MNFSDIDHEAWERSIDEPVFYDDLSVEYNNQEELISNEEHSDNLIPIKSFHDKQKSYIIDQIEPILLLNENHQENFIEKFDQTKTHSLIEQDYITIEQQSDTSLDPNDLAHRLSQLNLSNQTLINEENSKLTATETFKHPLSIPKPINNSPIRYQTQRIEKVSDLEIVKQGKGFKIGYIDRQGTDQRIILTKRIEAGPDIIERDPHIRLPYKGRRLLNQIYSSVLYTNGYNKLEEDKKFQRSADNIQVPIIGTNPKHFDEVCIRRNSKLYININSFFFVFF